MNDIEGRLEQLADMLDDYPDNAWVGVVQSARTDIRRLRIEVTRLQVQTGDFLTTEQYLNEIRERRSSSKET